MSVDLAGRALGGTVLACSDELFAEADNLITAGDPEHRRYTFGHKGQVYDGWETRRHRDGGDRDWALLRLGAPGVVHEVVLDTAYFTGNAPVAARVEATWSDGYPGPAELAGADWVELVPRSSLTGDHRHVLPVTGEHLASHLRLTIYPDGGVARLRAHGDPVPDPDLLAGLPLDLAAAEYGGSVTGGSDDYYGSASHLLLPGLATVMGEGWETRRRRDDGNDWVLVALAAEGVPRVVELDTSHFKGNAPAAATITGYRAPGARVPPPGADWSPLLGRTTLRPDTRHRFLVAEPSPVSHVRLDIHPDGGMARFRVYGELTAAGASVLRTRRQTLLRPDGQPRLIS